MRTEVSLKLPLPLDIASTLMTVLGKVYPNSRVSTESREYLTFLIEDEDRGLDVEAITQVEAERASEAQLVLQSVRDGSFDMTMPEFVSNLIVNAFGDILNEAEAENYLEMEVSHEGTRYAISACRSLKQTPHQLRQIAEKKAELYAGKLRELGIDPDSL